MSQLTIPDVPVEVEYSVTSASTGPFVVPFPFFQIGDVQATVVDAAGTETALVVTTDFTFTTLTVGGTEGNGYSDGEITLSASIGADGGTTLVIYRSLVIDRTSNYPTAGPISIALLNDELNKHVGIMQELRRDKDTYLNVPEGQPDGTGFDADARTICNAGESNGAACLATNRQVDASGPNWLFDSNNESAVGNYNQWNEIVSETGIVIQGTETATTKLFDLMTQYYTTLQNRNGAVAQFYIRYRYQVDCYAQISKLGSITYPIDIPATASIPFHFMDIEQDIDYFNGDCTLTVAIDLYPIGSDSNDLYLESSNLAVTTSEPR